MLSHELQISMIYTIYEAGAGGSPVTVAFSGKEHITAEIARFMYCLKCKEFHIYVSNLPVQEVSRIKNFKRICHVCGKTVAEKLDGTLRTHHLRNQPDCDGK